MKYRLQSSQTGKDPWKDEPQGFSSKEKAREFFTDVLEYKGLDWRAGFLLRLKGGPTYRLLNVRTKEPVE